MNSMIMKSLKTFDPVPSCRQEHIRDVGRFLSAYAAYLLGCGATCVRLEKNVARMAEAWRMEATMAIMPRHIHLTVSDKLGLDTFTFIAPIRNGMVSYDINTRLSRLSWDIADRGTGVDEAYEEFHRICRTPPAHTLWVLLAASLANASFCRLFGGDFVAMGVVFVATVAGYCLKQLLLERKMDVRVVFILCAFVSSVLGATDGLFALGTTPSVALGTSVLYMVPGIPLLNAFSDMLDGHYVCSFSRMTNSVILTCCLSIGLYAGMWLMNVRMF